MSEVEPTIFDEGLVTVAYGAAFLGISRSQFYELMNKGLIRSCRILSSRRIPKKELIEFAMKCASPE